MLPLPVQVKRAQNEPSRSTTTRVITSFHQFPSVSISFHHLVGPYLSACRANGISIQPLVVNTFGGWAPSAVKVLKQLGYMVAKRTKTHHSITISTLFRKLSVTLQRSNGLLLQNKSECFE